MTIREDLVLPSKYQLKCPYSMVPEFIVVHNTANDASAANEINYMTSNDNSTSFHYAVDDKEVVQGIPEFRNAWHAGDGNGDGNRKGIAVEICYSLSGGIRFVQAEDNAARFIASVCERYGWTTAQVKRHKDFNGKNCPHRTMKLGWDRFLNKVDLYLSHAEQPESEPINDYKLEYYAHVESLGDLDIARDGQIAGTTGAGLRLEALYINTEDMEGTVEIDVKMHIQNVGWKTMTNVESGDEIGTHGESLRLECLIFDVRGLPEGKTLYCSGHIENIGWVENIPAGYPIGTTHQALRLEAIKLWVGDIEINL